MFCVETNGKRTIIHGNETYHHGEKLTDQDIVDRKQLDLLKFKYVSKGDYFKAYIIDEIEHYLKGHEQDYEYFFFMLEVVSEITVEKNVTINVQTLIEYMMKDIKAFKSDFESAKSISSFLSDVMADVEMIL